MKRLLFVALFIAVLATGAAVSAQTVDHWSTEAECLVGLNDPSVPFYVPSLTSKKNGKFTPSSNKVVRGLPANACIEMDLPDRMGGRGYVKVAAGEEMVYEYNSDNTVGRILTMKACNNDVYNVSTAKAVAKAPIGGQAQAQAQQVIVNAPQGPQGPVGPQGQVGPQGPIGPAGSGCTVKQVPDEKGKMRDALICADGTNALFPKQKGMSKTAKVVIGTTAAVTATTVILCVILKKCGKAPRIGPVVTTLP